jgi:hypothetical protein
VQAEHGVLEGNITSSGKLRIGDEEFDELNTNGILGCNSGSITTGQNQTRSTITSHLAAAFHRTVRTILPNRTHSSRRIRRTVMLGRRMFTKSTGRATLPSMMT